MKIRIIESYNKESILKNDNNKIIYIFGESHYKQECRDFINNSMTNVN